MVPVTPVTRIFSPVITGTTSHESGSQESGSQESGSQESGSQESGSQESGRGEGEALADALLVETELRGGVAVHAVLARRVVVDPLLRRTRRVVVERDAGLIAHTR